MPSPERHWCSMPGTEAAQETAPQVAPHASPVRARRLRRRAPAGHQRDEVLPDAHHVPGHSHVTAPGPDVDAAIRVDHQGGGPPPQRVDRAALRVVAAARRRHHETAVERGHQRGGLGRLDRRGVTVRASAGAPRPGVQPGGQQAGVHPRDPGWLRAAGRDEGGLVDGTYAADRPSGRAPGAFAGRHGGPERRQPGGSGQRPVCSLTRAGGRRRAPRRGLVPPGRRQ